MHRPVWLLSMDSEEFQAPPTTTAALTAYFRKYGHSSPETDIELVHFQSEADISRWLDEWVEQVQNLPLVRKVRWVVDVDPQDY